MTHKLFKPVYIFLFLVNLSFIQLRTDSYASNPDDVIRPRIVGGIEASPGSWPFMVGLFSKGSGNKFNRQFCGGSLIATTWVVTAAHCIAEETPQSMEVGIGLHDLRQNGGETINVKRIIPHPQYNENTSNNDIALLELASPSNTGTIIGIADPSSELAGLVSTAIGWGTTSSGGSSSPLLLQVDLQVITNNACNTMYGNSITAGMVCAGVQGGGKDACQGDSGGPLVIGGTNAPLLIGATSFGEGCALPNKFGVWARVPHYLSWINEYTPTSSSPVSGNPPPPVSVTPSEPLSETDGDYGLWNGFIGLVNIAEIQNTSGSAVTAKVNLFNAAGTHVSTNSFSVPAGQQFDVILNQLSGYSTDSYGVVQISSNVSGRISYYKPKVSGSFTDFDFAYALPFAPPITNKSSVSFNTFQPSFNPGETSNLVANWLSVVNLDTGTKSFLVKKYNQSGVLLSETNISLASRNRADIDGGHVSPGPGNVGLLEIVPVDINAKYSAQLVRYGYKTGGTAFNFAFPLVATKGLNGTHYFPVGDRDTHQNWIELVNPSSQGNSAQVQIFSESGNLLSNQTIGLNPYSQFHLNTSQILPAGSIGFGSITPTGGTPLASQSMFYFRDPVSGSISSISGTQEVTSGSSILNGSYNLFLSMESRLRLHNTAALSGSANILIASQSSSGASGTMSFAPFESKEVNLHDFGLFGTIANSYGTVRVTPTGNALIFGTTTRLKRNTNTLPQFVVPGLLK
ncbi:MAG TPA: serine protease [Oligoflexia bacterium]|nr:serine protease [Oligoflexia bacterium]HMP47674.1 serine protease [Oligoflexia bacterium]